MLDQPDGQLSIQGLDPLQGRHFFVRKRDGRRQEFNEARIYLAIESAFRATLGIEPNEPLRDVLQIELKNITDPVVQKVLGRAVKGQELEVEAIQDAVEEQLMRMGHLAVARRYILYRDERRRARVVREKQVAATEALLQASTPNATSPPAAEGRKPSKNPSDPRQWAELACKGLEEGWSVDRLINECVQQAQTGGQPEEREKALSEAAKAQMGREPAFERVAERLLLRKIYRQAWPQAKDNLDIAELQRRGFKSYISAAVENQQLAGGLLEFDLEALAGWLRLERDQLLGYHGLETLCEEYLLRESGQCVETPQYFWMRLAMGLALNEGPARDMRAAEFYEALSSLRFVPSQEILLGAGTLQPRLTTVYRASGWNDLEHIRAEPGGRMPGGKGLNRAWLEPWHVAIGDFLTFPRRNESPWEQDLGKGIWIPDLFMKRVRENGHWTLFDPANTPDLHALHGRAFERRYLEYERRAERGELPFSSLPASAIWGEMLASLSETGQPWLGFKDAANVRSMQAASGAVMSGNLRGDILLDAGPDRVSACGVGAVNLAAHVKGQGLDEALLQRTVETAMRMLDNALDVGAYPCLASRRTALEQRPVALGIAGFEDMLHKLKLSYASPSAVEWADRSMESVSYFAILASTDLARERGAYSAFEKSTWKFGILPIDTLAVMEQERRMNVEIDRSGQRDWTSVRAALRAHGMRHCAATGISPVKEGSLIAGVTPSIEPSVRLTTGELSSGKCVQWNPHFVADLKALNLWNHELIVELQNSEGSIQHCAWIPVALKEVYQLAFEIAPRWLVECAARRQKWLDMSQALTLDAGDIGAARMSEIYMLAWEKGLKAVRQAAATGLHVKKNAEPSQFPELAQKAAHSVTA